MAKQIKVAALNEDWAPLKGVDVEMMDLSTLLPVDVKRTSKAGVATFTSGITGIHFFRVRDRRVSTKVGGRTYTGLIRLQVIQNLGGLCYDHVVQPDGLGTSTTIQGALDAAVENDVIAICPGAYVEDVTIPANVTVHLIGLAAPSVASSRYQDWAVTLQGSTGSSTPALTVTAGYGRSSVSGIAFLGKASQTAPIVDVPTSAVLGRIQNCGFFPVANQLCLDLRNALGVVDEVFDCYFSSATGAVGIDTGVATHEQATINRCTFHAPTGIRCGEDVIITGCYFFGSNLELGPGTLPSDVLIEANHFFGSKIVATEPCKDITIRGNHFHNTSVNPCIDFSSENAKNCVIAGNTFNMTAQTAVTCIAGAAADACQGNVIIDNAVLSTVRQAAARPTPYDTSWAHWTNYKARNYVGEAGGIAGGGTMGAPYEADIDSLGNLSPSIYSGTWGDFTTDRVAWEAFNCRFGDTVTSVSAGDSGALAASSTFYMEVDSGGTVYFSSGSFTSARIPLAVITTAAYGRIDDVDRKGALLFLAQTAGGSNPGPDDAQYLVLALDGDLSAERVLVAGSGLTLTDGGANGNATLDLGALTENWDAGGTYSILVDTINESDSGAGVTIEGILLKDSIISWSGDTNLYRSAANTLATDDVFHARSGAISVGVDDTTQGSMVAYGSSGAGGGALHLYLGADHDAVFHSYAVYVSEDDLLIDHDSANDLTIKADRSIEIPTGPLKINTIGEYGAGLGVTIEGIKLLDSFLEFPEISKPSNPSDGYSRLYMRSTDHLYFLGTGGQEHNVSMPFLTVNKGVLSAISVSGGGGLNITWGAGVIYDQANEVLVATDAQGSPQACTANDVTYLYWASGTGLTLSTTAPSGDNVPVAHITCDEDNIIGIHTEPVLAVATSQMRTGLGHVFGTIVADGLVVSEDTDVTNALDVSLSTGSFVHEDFAIHTVGSPILSRSVPLIRWYHVSGAWVTDTDAEINEDYYDDLTDLVEITGGDLAKYFKSAFYTDGTNIHWVYPNAGYVTVAQAIAAPVPTPPEALAHQPACTAVVMKGSDSAFPTAGEERWIDIRPRLGVANPGTVTDHGSLAGTGDDDHTQYLLANGSRPLSATWEPGSQDIGNYDFTAKPLDIYIGDSAFRLYLSTDPFIQFDANDYLQYVRASNYLSLFVGSTEYLRASAGGLYVDTITELTGAAGVTIEGVLLKDSIISWSGDTNLYRSGANILKTDDRLDVVGRLTLGVNETTYGYIWFYGGATGSADGGRLYLFPALDYTGTLSYWRILADEDDLRFDMDVSTWLKFLGGQNIIDSYKTFQVDVINEHTGAAGVTIDGLLIKDGAITLTDIDGGGWKLPYTDASGDVTELALGANATVLAGTSTSGAPVFEEIYVSHIAVFIPDGEDLDVDTFNPRAFCVGESGEHGTFTAIPRAKVVAGTAGAGTNTILVEADDNPAFSSPTVLFTLALDANTEVDDTSLDNAWASGDIWVRARCTAVDATAPKNVIVQFFYKERAEAF